MVAEKPILYYWTKICVAKGFSFHRAHVVLIFIQLGFLSFIKTPYH